MTTTTNSPSPVSVSPDNEEARSFRDYKDVAAAIRPYIEDAARTGDGKLARTVFYDHAHVMGRIGGQLQNETADDFAGVVTSIGPSPQVEHRIVWIDISGPAAAVKVEFSNWAGFRFTDFFVLFRGDDGQWKISGMVFDCHSKEKK